MHKSCTTVVLRFTSSDSLARRGRGTATYLKTSEPRWNAKKTLTGRPAAELPPGTGTLERDSLHSLP
ncbi:hypothetical protein NHX12_006012 [Muraenolepis orangiensis]|uniref:Uncharacterized protein n=1 Tax=Muraenolepis orangiensis TaxID=630683 RepID=A0A9Q0DSL9_9TELE|nr:hypothetical protein NHX12_006012 [Muraenolepis orangiensis]